MRQCERERTGSECQWGWRQTAYIYAICCIWSFIYVEQTDEAEVDEVESMWGWKGLQDCGRMGLFSQIPRFIQSSGNCGTLPWTLSTRVLTSRAFSLFWYPSRTQQSPEVHSKKHHLSSIQKAEWTKDATLQLGAAHSKDSWQTAALTGEKSIHEAIFSNKAA